MTQYGFIPTVPYPQQLQACYNGQPIPNLQCFTDPNIGLYSNTYNHINNSQWMPSNKECPINTNQWLPTNMQQHDNMYNQWLPSRCQHPIENNQWMPPKIGSNCLPQCGEGAALPVQGVDGQVKFYFIPKINCVPQFPCNCPNSPIGCHGNPEVGWLITSVLPTVQDFAKQTGFLNSNLNAFGQSMELCYNNNGPQPRILLFHSDNTTSTTDLHYFFPNLRGSYWIPAVDESVQAEQKTNFATQCFDHNCTQTTETDSLSDEDPEEDFCDCSPNENRRGKKSKSLQRASCPDEDLRFTLKKKSGFRSG